MTEGIENLDLEVNKEGNRFGGIRFLVDASEKEMERSEYQILVMRKWRQEGLKVGSLEKKS